MSLPINTNIGNWLSPNAHNFSLVTLCGDQFTLSTQLIIIKLPCYTLPPTQHHSLETYPLYSFVSWSVRQSGRHSVSQSYRQSVKQSTRQRFSQPVRLSSDKSVTTSSQWTNQSSIHAGNWYISQPAGKSVTLTVFQSFQLDFDKNYSATVHYTTI